MWGRKKITPRFGGLSNKVFVMLKCQMLEGEQVLGEEVKNSVVSSVSLSCLIDSWVEMSNRQLCLLDTQVEM